MVAVRGGAPVKKDKKKKVTARRAERPSIPLHMVIRMFLIGAVAVIGSIYALWRHYSVPRTPMLVPAPSSSEVPIEYEPER